MMRKAGVKYILLQGFNKLTSVIIDYNNERNEFLLFFLVTTRRWGVWNEQGIGLGA